MPRGIYPALPNSVYLDALNVALATNNTKALQECLFAEQAYWKDALALTYHLRTFFLTLKKEK
jgi:hypothetical protein